MVIGNGFLRTLSMAGPLDTLNVRIAAKGLGLVGV
jgi:hypothetical protein